MAQLGTSQWFGLPPTLEYCHHWHLHNIGLQEVRPLSINIDGGDGCLLQEKFWSQKPLNSETIVFIY